MSVFNYICKAEKPRKLFFLQLLADTMAGLAKFTEGLLKKNDNNNNKYERIWGSLALGQNATTNNIQVRPKI